MTKQEKAAVISIATNFIITVVKFVLASVTGSVALLAEAYHSFADILSSTMLFLALRADRNDRSVSSNEQPATEDGGPARNQKPRFFASGNWENKVALGIGVLLILAAINIFGKVGQSTPLSVRYPLVAAILVGFLAVCSHALFRFEVSVGEDAGSTALIADGHHAQTDMLASVLVMISLLAAKLGLGFDKIAAGIIASYILIIALHILVHAIREYSSVASGRAVSDHAVYEDILFFFAYRTYSKINDALWKKVGTLPGLKGPPEVVKTRFTLMLIGAGIVVALGAYTLSGVYILQPGERAIVERFGKPLQTGDPVGPGLHYHWPWPAERIKKADVENMRRLTIGYKTDKQEYLILWTNKHYLREYSILTGEGPFLDVAMNVHYRIKNLYGYLFNNADPDGAVEKIGYQVLGETIGTRPFFASITADRDTLEDVILNELQRRIDELGLGLMIQNVCFRDLHPPTQVAPAFEDVVSAQEDHETYIEEAHAYRKDLLPRARASAVTEKTDAGAYRNALIAQSEGKAQSFSMMQEAYNKAKSLTRTRLLLETIEDALSGVPKYIVTPSEKGERPDLWFSMPPFAGLSVNASPAQAEGQDKTRERKEFKMSSEEDLIDAITRFQQENAGAEK